MIASLKNIFTHDSFVTDDRRRKQLFSQTADSKHATELSRRIEKLLLRAERTRTIRRQRGTARWALILIRMGLAVSYFMCAGSIRAHFGGWASLAVFVAMLAFSVWLGRIFRRGTFSQTVASSRVAEGMCGACAYSLENLVPENDGCLVCPECGAAWKHSRVVSPAWQRERVSVTSHVARRWWHVAVGRAPDVGEDDRLRITEFVDSRLSLLSSERRRSMDPATVRELRGALRRLGRRWQIVFWVVCVLIAALACWGAIATWDDRSRVAPVLLLSLGFAASTTAGCIALFGETGIEVPKRRRLLLLRRVCPACVADLSETRDADDGCVTCPVCGSGWRAADIGQ